MPAASPSPAEEPLTTLLQRAASGSADAAAAVLPQVYRQLRAIARARMAGERANHTLQATVLVHEAWMRLVGDGSVNFAERGEFFRAAAEVMRRLLIDHARRRSRQKRGGQSARTDAELDLLPADDGVDGNDPDAFLALEAEIRRLEASDPRAGAVVRLRYFAGLDVDATAAALQLSRRTVLREWAYARARLQAALRPEPDESTEGRPERR
jgi:RNA polymerase sigma factor (TIGR02999 family)